MRNTDFTANRLSPLGATALVLMAAFATGLLGGCEQGEKSPSAPEQQRHVSATVMTTAPENLPVLARFPGSVITSDQVGISSRVMGYVRSINVHEGQSVQKGEILLTIDPTDVMGGISQAQAGVEKARAALNDAKSNFDRFKSLYAQHAVPKQRFEQMQTAYQVAQSNYTAAKAALKQAKAQLDYAKIKAPFAGTITSRSVDPGQLAYPSQPLLMLQSSGHRQIKVQVNGQAYAALKPNEAIQVSYNDANGVAHHFSGAVERMVEASDPVTHTHTVKIGVPDDIDLRSGNYVEVAIRVAEKQGIALPLAAIHHRAGLAGVFVVDANGQAWFRLVRLGSVNGNDKQVVLSGVDAGEKVVVQSNGRLENGVYIDQDKQAAS